MFQGDASVKGDHMRALIATRLSGWARACGAWALLPIFLEVSF